MKIGILGAGSWGTALAHILAHNGHLPCLWAIDPQICEDINLHHRNPTYLPEASLHQNISCSLQLGEVTEGADTLIIAVPSKIISTCLDQLKPHYQGQPIILASKGRNASDFAPFSQLIEKKLGQIPLIVLSGASHAEEVMHNHPTGVVLASKDPTLAKKAKSWLQTPFFKCEISEDVESVQLAGAFKNIIAIACWCSDGLGYGINTKALLLTQGIREFQTLATALYINAESMRTYAGIGDIFVTCSSSLSRNRNAGKLLAYGHTKADITWNLMRMVAEGFFMLETVQSFLQRNPEVQLPLCQLLIDICKCPQESKVLFDDFITQL